MVFISKVHLLRDLFSIFLNQVKYCWTKSYRKSGVGNYKYCLPDGDGWNYFDPTYVNPVTHPFSCGSPCHDVHEFRHAPTPAPVPPHPDHDDSCEPASGDTVSGMSYTGN